MAIDKLQEKIDQLEVKDAEVDNAIEIVENKIATAQEENPNYKYMFQERIKMVHESRNIEDDADIYKYFNTYDVPDDPEIQEQIKKLREKWVE